MKTYVLTLSKNFLKGHPRQGQPTQFKKALLNGIKKHTFRLNYEYWSKIINEVQAGKAVLSIRQWSGKPYASPQDKELLCLDAYSGIGYQIAEIDYYNFCVQISKLSYDCGISIETAAQNDALSLKDFQNWFKLKPKENVRTTCIIIHFTKFRY